MQEKNKEEIETFPPEMTLPNEDKWEDYSNLRRHPKDTDAIRKIWLIFSRRLFPVLSFTYIASVIGISLSREHILLDKSAYLMGFAIMGWVAIAPTIWILVRVIDDVRKYAKSWYLWTAGTQAVCGLVFYFLFPETSGDRWLWGLTSFFVASIPIHIVIYFFFMQRALAASYAWPLTLAGVAFMLFGLFIV
ncbi:MAG: hypothetical protein H6855_01785 [Rhodospirillales bacterium]|nr:hypothetical protein [Rhodospirillales bacterium]MCB9964795.1 hypothetical protein [Rhodospirillales bacterium]MCB9973844.1 hypothetical protein [Rhodospirillales bacterium]MCB9980499.1 hypothetical protein [Rhodospirillales bacterium]